MVLIEYSDEKGCPSEERERETTIKRIPSLAGCFAAGPAIFIWSATRAAKKLLISTSAPVRKPSVTEALFSPVTLNWTELSWLFNIYPPVDCPASGAIYFIFFKSYIYIFVSLFLPRHPSAPGRSCWRRRRHRFHRRQKGRPRSSRFLLDYCLDHIEKKQQKTLRRVHTWPPKEPSPPPSLHSLSAESIE